MVKKANPKDVLRLVQKEVVASNGHIELSMREILDMREALIRLMQKPLPARASFRLAQLGNILNPYLTAFKETNDKLIHEMGAPVEGTKNYQVTDENMEAFRAQNAALLDEKVSIPVFKITLPPTLEIEAMVLLPLERLLEVSE